MMNDFELRFKNWGTTVYCLDCFRNPDIYLNKIKKEEVCDGCGSNNILKYTRHTFKHKDDDEYYAVTFINTKEIIRIKDIIICNQFIGNIKYNVVSVFKIQDQMMIELIGLFNDFKNFEKNYKESKEYPKILLEYERMRLKWL